MYRTYAKMDISGSQNHDDYNGDPPTLCSHILDLISINFFLISGKMSKHTCLPGKKTTSRWPETQNYSTQMSAMRYSTFSLMGPTLVAHSFGTFFDNFRKNVKTKNYKSPKKVPKEWSNRAKKCTDLIYFKFWSRKMI